MRALHRILWVLVFVSGISNAATIGGHVTRVSNATPIANARLIAFRSTDFGIENQQLTSADGSYLLSVNAGTYFIAVAASGFAGEIYDNLICPPCDPAQATLVTVAASDNRGGVDFDLVALPAISGSVRRAGSMTPVEDVPIRFETLDGAEAATGSTDGSGNYSIGIADGSYRIRAGSGSGMLGQYFAGVTCNILLCDPAGATPVSMAGADVSGIDFVLEPGGAVSGMLLRQSDSAPLDTSAAIEVYKPNGDPLFAFQAFTPSYQTTEPLPSGSYRVLARPGALYLPKVWNNRSCAGIGGSECDPAAGDAVTISAGTTTTNVDFALALVDGTVSGHVTNFAGGAALEGVTIRARRESDGIEIDGTTLADGTFELTVPFGIFTIRAIPAPPLAEELYPNVQCAGSTCAGSPELLSLGGGQVRADVDFALSPPGSITIGVRDGSNSALLPAELKLLLPGLSRNSQFFVDADSTITIPVLSGGPVRFAARNNGGGCGPAPLMDCLGELYPDTPCPNLQCDLATGVAIPVAKGEEVAGIEIVLGKGADISGQLRAEGTLVPIVGATIEIIDANNALVGGADTDASGHYVSTGYNTGPYFARTRTSTFRDELFDGFACPSGACSPAIGTPIATMPGQTSPGIDFVLAPGSLISGKVRSANDLQGIANAIVTVFDSSGQVAALATTGSNGNYTTGALVAGSYHVRFDASGFDSQLFNGVSCTPSSCDPASGTPVSLAPPANAIGVGADLAGDNSAAQDAKIVFINICKPSGCAVQPGQENAIANTSALVPSPRVLPPFPFSDAVFDQVVQCVQNTFSPFSVIVTTSDPGNVAHREFMYTTFPLTMGLPPETAGISPWACGVPLENSISFGFANVYGEDVGQLCTLAAHEIGHQMGLDHEFYCPDHMTYLEGCGLKSFVDIDAQCGTSSGRDCYCGSAPTQNTFAKLAAVAGLNVPIFADGFDPPAAASFGKLLGPQSNSSISCGTDTQRPSPLQAWPPGVQH
jgi:hypothetical protein